MCRFNLSAQELHATILEPWVRDRLFEFGERKWDPQRAALTVIEGPRIAPGQLTMGRGWRTAQRQGREVAEELLAAARAALTGESVESESGVAGAGVGGEQAGSAGAGESRGPAGPGGADPGGADVDIHAGGGEGAADLVADSLGLELLSRIGAERAPLDAAWELAQERGAGLPASASLALAERAVTSLLRGRLIVLLRGAAEADLVEVEEVEAPSLVLARASWIGAGGRAGVWLRRA
jgi:hypothetical protein